MDALVYEQQAWTPTSFATYRSAVMDEGKQTLSVVTENLYQGGNRSPDVYFKSKFGEAKYKNTFNNDQRLTLENCKGYFNIRTAVGKYDISLNYVLQEYVCGLSPKGDIHWQIQGTFENMLNKVHKKRNEVSHKDWDMNENKLREELLELQKLYADILNLVERKTYRSIHSNRSRIMNSLKEKFPDVEEERISTRDLLNDIRMQNGMKPYSYGSRQSSSMYCGRNNSDLANGGNGEESSGLQTFGKIAAGVVGVAAAAWGVSKLMDNNKVSEKDKSKRQKNSNEDDCSIM